jgi:hypothetical protein
MGRRNPRLRQPSLDQRLPHQASIGAVGLGPTLPAPQRRRVRRFGQMGPEPGPFDLLDHEPPTRAPLTGQIHLLTSELAQPLPEPFPGHTQDPTPTHIPGVGIQHIERDLTTVNIQPTYDGHGTSSTSCLDDTSHSRSGGLCAWSGEVPPDPGDVRGSRGRSPLALPQLTQLRPPAARRTVTSADPGPPPPSPPPFGASPTCHVFDFCLRPSAAVSPRRRGPRRLRGRSSRRCRRSRR